MGNTSKKFTSGILFLKELAPFQKARTLSVQGDAFLVIVEELK